MKTFLTALCLLITAFAGAKVFAQPRGGEVVAPDRPIVAGKTYALIVGISDYESEMIRPLNYAESDARSFANYLKSNSGGNIPKENIIELYGKDATSSNIWERGIGHYIFRMKKMFTRGDRLVLYFSGHGGAFNNYERDNAFFFVYDANHATDGDANLKLSQVKDMIHTLIEEGVQVIFIFDACRSLDVGVEGGIERVNQIIEEQQGEVLMTASKGGKVAYESSKIQHGVFTYYLLRGLYGEADQAPKDGKIKGYELDNYLKTKVRVYSQNEFKEEQIPFLMWGPSNSLEESDLFEYNTTEGMQVIASLDRNTASLTESSLLAGKGILTTDGPGKEDYLSLFNNALTEKRIIRPENDCAYFYFQKLQGHDKGETLDPLQRQLSIALMDMARNVLNEDLKGERNYYQRAIQQISTTRARQTGKPFSITQLPEYQRDENYYSVPQEALIKYIDITPPEAQNPSARSMLAYLRASSSSTNEEQAVALEALDEELALNETKSYLHHAKGFLLNEMGKFEEAIASLKRAMMLSPLWSYPVGSLSYSFGNLGHADSALFYLKEFMRQGAKVDFLIYNNIGANYANHLKDFDSAIFYYRKALALNPAYAITYCNLGSARHNQNQFDSAAYYYRAAIKLNPQFSRSHYALADLMTDLDQFDSADFYYHKALKLKPDDPDTYHSLGYLKYLQAQLDSATFYYQKALQFKSMDERLYYGLGLVKTDQDKSDSAVYYFHRGLNINPENADINFQLGFKKSLHAELDSAEFYFWKVLKLEPEYADVYYALGDVKADKQQSDSAYYYYLKTVKLDPGHSFAYYNLAIINKKKNRFDSAAYYYRKAIKADPKDSDSYINLGALKFNQGQVDSAIFYFKKTLKINPREADAYYNIGFVKTQQGQLDSAAFYYHKILELNLEHQYVYTSLAWLKLKQGQADSAEYFLKKDIMIHPENSASYYDLACLYSIQNKKKAGLDMLEKAFISGFENFDWARKDPALINLQKAKTFEKLIRKYSKEPH